MPSTDSSLVRSSLSGDASAFAALYDAYVQRIYRYHYYRTFHKETAEDLTSQTFIRALEHLKTFDERKGTFSAWLYRIARNLLVDHVRKARPVADLDEMWDAIGDGKDLRIDLEKRDLLENAAALIKQLPTEQRDLIVMRVWDELTYAEIAELTGKSEAACKMAVSRALASLRKQAPLAALLLLIPRLFL